MGEGCDGDGIWVSNHEDLGFAILYRIIWVSNPKNLGLTGLTGMANPGRTRNGNLLVDLAKVSRVQGSALDEANIFPKDESILKKSRKNIVFLH